VVVAGCNDSGTPASVSGKITYKGEDVPTGSITFFVVSDTEHGSFPYPIRDAKYSGTDLPTGEYVVTIETESANPNPNRPKMNEPGAGKKDPTAEYQQRMQEAGAAPSGPANVGPYVKIPLKYAQKKTSPLKLTLTKGKNAGDFDLTD
jgi:hypothetical protein